MSLKGDLESFPIIDIIQLLNGSKKSGILRLSSNKGESQLVFHDGDLVSANHLNSRVRIGQVLVRAGAITAQQLAEALDIQKNAGDNRKPLVITLLEHNMVEETAAYNGIEALIEMTIVEVLTWKTGEFSFEITRGDNVDGYHFSKTESPQRIFLNAQGILMESLRIFDEKMRDGTMDEILSIAGISNSDLDTEQPGGSTPVMTSDGSAQTDVLSGLQQLLTEQREMIRRSSDHGYREVNEVTKLVNEEFPSATKENKQLLVALLAGPPPTGDAGNQPQNIAVIVITPSPMLATMVRSICFQENIYSVSSETMASLAINMRLLLCQTVQIVILLDVPHDDTAQEMMQICSDLQKYPQAAIVLIACAHFWGTLGLQALSSGIRTIIPKPCKECAGESPVHQALAFSTSLGAFFRTLSLEHRNSDDQRFFTCITQLRTCKTRSEIAVTILGYLIDIFERAIVFSVTDLELVAEESFGIRGGKSDGLELISNLKIPLDDQKIFEDVVKTGQLYFGFHSDSTWPHELYRLIGRMEDPEVLLFPLVRANTVTAVIYADFGSKPALSPSLRYLNALLQYTTAQIGVSAYRHKLKTMMEQIKSGSKAAE